jgi:hypothetical protein
VTSRSARDWERAIQERLHGDVLCGALEEFSINENDNTVLINGWMRMDNLRWIATMFNPSTGMYKEVENGNTNTSAETGDTDNDTN